MTLVVMVFVVAVSALLQITLPSFALLGSVKFPFLLAVVLYYAMNRDTVPMLAAALLAGLLQDILTPMMPLGYSVFCFCVVGWVVGLFRRLVLTDSPVICAVYGSLSGLVAMLFMYFLLLRAGLIVCPVRRVILKAVASGMLAAVCVPIVFVVAARLDGILGNIQVRESIDGLE
ncbi:MAG: hypothetical protein KAH23_08205 [Kiritimatiellae bacterium]|nr:hypothetical protein [Kiritimatiellia bacterium]